MYYFSQALKALTVVAIIDQALAHPGHDLAQEVAEREAFLQNSKRDLSHCSAKLKKRGIEDKALKRRQASIAKARAARGLTKKHQVAARDLDTVLSTSHASSLDVTPNTSGLDDIIFGNSSCILMPEVTIGPYYVSGEYIRDDIREDQEGVEIIIDAQFIDVDTCEPVPKLMWDLWHCNSTGVYSGVVASGNGDSSDETNLDATFLRGLTETDDDGVAQVTSIFPGHYSGRTTHIHVVGHLNGTTLDNGTYSGGTISNIGQLFFDQDLITEIDTISPYSLNSQTLTTNEEDSIMASETENGVDPVLNYVLLGDSVSDGLFMWISIGIDTSASLTGTAAATLTADGGVENSNSGVGGGDMGGAPSGNGTATGPGGQGGNGTRPSGVAGASGLAPTIIGATSTGGASTLTSTATSTVRGTAAGTSATTSGAAVTSLAVTGAANRRGSVFGFLF